MAYTPKILAFAGSLRADSFNKRLLKIGIAGAESAGAQVTSINLKDFPLPVFDEDLEASEGMPANGRKIKDLMIAHDGFLLACPEYNSSITAALKNTIDWASRREKDEKPLVCFAGKVAGLMSASPGVLGGLRGLVTVRAILGNIQMIVLPDQVTIPSAHDAFNPDGSLKDKNKETQVRGVGKTLATTCAKLFG